MSGKELVRDVGEVDAYLHAVGVFVGIHEVGVLLDVAHPIYSRLCESFGNLTHSLLDGVKGLHDVLLHFVSVFEGRRSAPVVIRPYDLVVIEIVCDS